MDRLKDKVAIVTGAAAGIGEVTAKLFAQEGAAVTLCDVAMEPLEKVAADIKEAGGKAIAVKCNVADEGEVKSLMATTVETFGKLDILINNAGITRDGVALRMSEENWDLVMDINLKGTFLCCKHAIIKMKRGGKIINTASISSLGQSGTGKLLRVENGRYRFDKNLGTRICQKTTLCKCRCSRRGGNPHAHGSQ